MSRLTKFAIATAVVALTSLPLGANAGVQGGVPGQSELQGVTMKTFEGDTTAQKASSAAFNLLTSAKMILNGLAVIYLVYVGVMMILAYGDEGELSKQKKQLMYTLVAFLFVNIPGKIYNIFTAERDTKAVDVTVTPNGGDFAAVRATGNNNNIFLNFEFWNSTVENGVLGFLRIAVIGFALLYFVLAGFKLLVSGGSEDKRKAAKSQIIYGFLALIFLGVIQAWLSFAYSGDISKGQNLFASMANLALFFAGPTAIFFLTLGAWYYITSAGDEERAKKGKSIVINTFIAVIILLASYTFLKDLADFKLGG